MEHLARKYFFSSPSVRIHADTGGDHTVGGGGGQKNDRKEFKKSSVWMFQQWARSMPCSLPTAPRTRRATTPIAERSEHKEVHEDEDEDVVVVRILLFDHERFFIGDILRRHFLREVSWTETHLRRLMTLMSETPGFTVPPLADQPRVPDFIYSALGHKDAAGTSGDGPNESQSKEAAECGLMGQSLLVPTQNTVIAEDPHNSDGRDLGHDDWFGTLSSVAFGTLGTFGTPQKQAALFDAGSSVLQSSKTPARTRNLGHKSKSSSQPVGRQVNDEIDIYPDGQGLTMTILFRVDEGRQTFHVRVVGDVKFALIEKSNAAINLVFRGALQSNLAYQGLFSRMVEHFAELLSILQMTTDEMKHLAETKEKIEIEHFAAFCSLLNAKKSKIRDLTDRLEGQRQRQGQVDDVNTSELKHAKLEEEDEDDNNEAAVSLSVVSPSTLNSGRRRVAPKTKSTAKAKPKAKGKSRIDIKPVLRHITRDAHSDHVTAESNRMSKRTAAPPHDDDCCAAQEHKRLRKSRIEEAVEENCSESEGLNDDTVALPGADSVGHVAAVDHQFGSSLRVVDDDSNAQPNSTSSTAVRAQNEAHVSGATHDTAERLNEHPNRVSQVWDIFDPSSQAWEPFPAASSDVVSGAGSNCDVEGDARSDSNVGAGQERLRSVHERLAELKARRPH